MENITIPLKKKTASPKKSELSVRQVMDVIETSLDDDKAIDVVVIELTGKTEIADYMVIATGTSQRMISTMAQHLQENLKAIGVTGIAVEGKTNADWVLLDAHDVIVHLFRSEVREFYDLEKIWGDDVPRPQGNGDVLDVAEVTEPA